MYTLNVRLAALLLVGAALSGSGVHWLHSFQIHRHAQAYLGAAEQAYDAEQAKKPEERNLSRAIEYLNSYVGLKPDDLEAQKKLGFWLADARNYKVAYFRLEEVLRKLENSTDVRRKLVEVAITPAMQRWPDAEAHLQILLRDDPDNPELLELKARCQEAQGDMGGASVTFRRVIQLAPTTIDAYFHLMAALRRLGQPKQADDCMQKLVANNATSVSAQVLYCQYLLLIAQQPDEASRQAQKVLRLAPDDVRGVLLAGQCAVEKQRYEEAIQYADKAIRMAEGSPDGYRLLAQTKARMGRQDEALAALERGLGKTVGTPGYTDLLWWVANLHLDGGKPLEAQKLLAQLKELTQNAAAVRCLEARVEMALGHWTVALAAFEAIRPELADAHPPQPELLKRVDLWIGQCYAQTGNLEQQLAAYRRAVAIDPTFFPARDGIAELCINAGRFSDAVDEYRQAIRAGAPSEQVMLALARTMVLRNLRMPTAERDWEVVDIALREAAKIAPGSPQIPLLRAEVLMDQGRLREAEQLLRDLRKAAPDRAEFWIALAVLDERQEKWEMAREHLDEVRKKLGDSVQWRIARAHYLLRRAGAEAARDIRLLAEDNLEKFDNDDRLRLWNNLIAYSIQANDFSTAKRLCQRVAEKEPNNVRIRYLLFELILRSREYSQLETMLADVDRVLNEMEKSGGRGPLWLYGRAVRLTMEAKGKDSPLLPQALKYIAQARETRPSWPPLPLLAARVYELQANEDQMLESYKEALRLGEGDQAIIRKTVQLLRQKQRYAEAAGLLHDLQQRQTAFGSDLVKMNVEIETWGGDTLDQAVHDAERSVNIDSQDFRDHLWHGQILGVLAERAKTEHRPEKAGELQDNAEKALRRALALEGRSGEAWVALVHLLASTGQKEKALAAIAEAQQKIPPERAAGALAYMYESVGNSDEATRRYEEALATKPKDPGFLREVAAYYLRSGKSEAAETLLKRLLASANESTAADAVVWARRMYAMLLMQRGGFPNLSQALRLIDQNVASPSGSVDDRRVKAQLLLEDPRRTRLAEAIQTLEELIASSGRGTSRDRFVLAQLYLRQGDWRNYVSQMREVFGARNPDPAFVLAHIRALLQHGELAGADDNLKSLEKTAPNEFSTVSLRAELLVDSKKYSAAHDLLAAYLERPDARPATRTERQLLVARAAEQFARKLADSRQQEAAKPFLKQAEDLLRSYVQLQPDQESLLAGFLARQGRTREALDLVAQTWKTGNLEGLATVAVAVIHSGSASDAELARLDQILQAALAQFNRPLLLLAALADSSLRQQRYPAAEAVYREILKRDPQNVTALNNLGVMLAFEGKRLKEAMQLISRAVDIAGPVPDVLDSRATVYIAMERPDLALDDLNAAIADEATALRLFRQARAYLLAGRKTEAAGALQAAEQKNLKRSLLDPPERPFYDKLRADLQT
jgi:tetratricopeptide (TPR) repeat protein